MNKDSISYRRATNRDSGFIKPILVKSFQEYDIDIPENYSFSDIEEIENTYIKSNGEFIVLLKDDSIIGFVGLIPINKKCIELKRLYLTADERGKGLGQYLLNLAINTARSLNYKELQLETSSKFKEAISLYRKNGFFECEFSKKAIGHDVAFRKLLF